MMIDEYKKTVLYELEKATSEFEIEQIINQSIEQIPEGDLYRYLVVIYLHVLQNGLAHLSEENAATIKRKNIRQALNYLKQVKENRERQSNKPVHT